MTSRKTGQIDFLTTAVGRGHRFYLEGLRNAVGDVEPGCEAQIFIASEVSGALARPGWRAIKFLYRRGSSANRFGELYNRLRSGSSPGDSNVALRLFGAGLRRWWRKRDAPLVVDHPLLVRLLSGARDREPLVYMHGELVAPDESLVTGADLIITPTESVKRRFIDAGVPGSKIVVSGLCVERSLVQLAYEARRLRQERIDTAEPLTGAFFSSGAEPAEHCTLVTAAVRSCLRQGQRVIVFAADSGRLTGLLDQSGLMTAPGMRVQKFTSLADEECRLASVFTEIDYYVAPAHERTNWALGLGLPFFILMPCFGSFAPLNRELAVKHAQAGEISSISEASNFAEALEGLRKSGELQRMNFSAAEAAFSNASFNDIGGFHRSAKQLLQRLSGARQAQS